MNDIKRPGIQPQLIHMQIASLALTLINSLWVHSFPVNKDLDAFEWSSTLSGERERTASKPYCKAPQDIMQPPSSWPNPPHRAGSGTRTEKRRHKRAVLLFFIPSQHQKFSKSPSPNWLNDSRLSQSRAVCLVLLFASQQRPPATSLLTKKLLEWYIALDQN